MKLPIRFFDSKMIGDIIQRIEDHDRIENFLTSQTLSILFSMVNLIVFGIVLAIYSKKIVFVFFIGSLLYFFWFYLFMKRRRDIDYKRFAQMATDQSNIIQLIMGMQEIKLNNCERQKRWEWKKIQAKLFRINIESLSLNQYQQLGGLFFNETKNIIITIIAAIAVIKGQMTLGMMLAVQYILGQMNSPVDRMIVFLQSAQYSGINQEEIDAIEIKSEEVQEIIGKTPSKIIQYGTSLFFLIIILIITGSFFFRYPDTIEGRFYIVSTNSPVRMVAKKSGIITYLGVHDREEVEKGQILAGIEDAANWQDVLWLDSVLTRSFIEEPINKTRVWSGFPVVSKTGDCRSRF